MSETSLHKIRNLNNLSQSQLATISGVNLRTLQDFEQGRKPLKNAKGEMLFRLSLALNCSINDLLEIDIDTSKNNTNASQMDANKSARLKAYSEKLSTSSLYAKYYYFPVVVPNSKVEMRRVYPTKQALIYKLHEELYPDSRITAIMLFGSSVTMQCHSDSDIDLAIRLHTDYVNNDVKNDVSEKVQEICNWNADIIWYDRIDANDRIYHDICKGVQIV